MADQSASADKMEPHLISIPLEVLLLITAYLTTPEYGNLRRTCRSIEDSLFKPFCREFFTKKQFMFTEFSLQALVDISRSRLSLSLSNIVFGLEQPTIHPTSIPRLAHGSTNIPHTTRCSIQEHVNYRTLINTGHDVDMLIEAFSNLKNVHTIGLRDFYSASRTRDDTKWRSYGVKTYEECTGRQLKMVSRFGSGSLTNDELTRPFLNLLRALGKAGCLPRNVEVILRSLGLPDFAFHIPKHCNSEVLPVLANLRTLFLEIDSPSTSTMVDIDLLVGQGYLKYFISKLSQLEHLRLNFRFERSGGYKDFMLWLSTPVSHRASQVDETSLSTDAVQPIFLTNLRQLDLGLLSVAPNVLLEILYKYQATLKTLNLHKVTLIDPLPTSTSKDKVDLWAQFLSKLSKLNLNLSAVRFSYLSQSQEGSGHPTKQRVIFKDRLHCPTRSWAGNDLHGGLRDFIAYTAIDWPEEGSENSQSDLDSLGSPEFEEEDFDEDSDVSDIVDE